MPVRLLDEGEDQQGVGRQAVELEAQRRLPAMVIDSLDDVCDQVQAIVSQLMQEHREVEAAFEALEPSLKRLAKGHDAPLSGAELAAQVRALVTRYEEHAHYEENELLPLSERILGRNSNHMAALGLSLHLRHALPEVLARFASRL